MCSLESRYFFDTDIPKMTFDIEKIYRFYESHKTDLKLLFIFRESQNIKWHVLFSRNSSKNCSTFAHFIGIVKIIYLFILFYSWQVTSYTVYV